MTNNDHKVIASFYSFTETRNIEIIMSSLLYVAKKKYIKGTIIISEEGFNGSLSGKRENIEYLINILLSETKAKEIVLKINECQEDPFTRIKIKHKQEIIALKSGKIDVTKNKGEYIESHAWDEFITRPDVFLIDNRNDYEVKMGSFKGAINPETDVFRSFPQWIKKNTKKMSGKKIALFCTGGVRCEKSTAYLKEQGYDEVYHLKGGILQYLDDTGNNIKMLYGSCFVFDNRIAVCDDLKTVIDNIQ